MNGTSKKKRRKCNRRKENAVNCMHAQPEQAQAHIYRNKIFLTLSKTKMKCKFSGFFFFQSLPHFLGMFIYLSLNRFSKFKFQGIPTDSFSSNFVVGSWSSQLKPRKMYSKQESSKEITKRIWTRSICAASL